jgi:hypothetical protein
MISVVRNFNARQRISSLQSDPRYLLDTAADPAKHPGDLSPPDRLVAHLSTAFDQARNFKW